MSILPNRPRRPSCPRPLVLTDKADKADTWTRAETDKTDKADGKADTKADTYRARALLSLALAECREGPRDLGAMRLREVAGRLEELDLVDLAEECRTLAGSPKRWKADLVPFADGARERLMSALA